MEIMLRHQETLMTEADKRCMGRGEERLKQQPCKEQEIEATVRVYMHPETSILMKGNLDSSGVHANVLFIGGRGYYCPTPSSPTYVGPRFKLPLMKMARVRPFVHPLVRLM